MLWRVQISLRHKLGLAGIFSLTVIIMIIAIVRVEVMYDEQAQAYGTWLWTCWLWTWSSIEQTVGVCYQIIFPLSNDIGGLTCFSYFSQPSSWPALPRSVPYSRSRIAPSGFRKWKVPRGAPRWTATRPNHLWRFGLWRRLQRLLILVSSHLGTSKRVLNLVKILQLFRRLFMFEETLMLSPMWRVPMKGFEDIIRERDIYIGSVYVHTTFD